MKCELRDVIFTFSQVEVGSHNSSINSLYQFGFLAF